jgi:hypothetical protein
MLCHVRLDKTKTKTTKKTPIDECKHMQLSWFLMGKGNTAASTTTTFHTTPREQQLTFAQNIFIHFHQSSIHQGCLDFLSIGCHCCSGASTSSPFQ